MPLSWIWDAHISSVMTLMCPGKHGSSFYLLFKKPVRDNALFLPKKRVFISIGIDYRDMGIRLLLP